MLIRIIRWILGVVLTVVFVIFAIANRQDVSVTWHPLWDAIDLPLYLVALIPLLMGFFIGSLIMWLGALPMRFNASRQKRKIEKLQKELDAAALVDEKHIPPSGFAFDRPSTLLSLMPGRKTP